jgi:hypothetical protein
MEDNIKKDTEQITWGSIECMRYVPMGGYYEQSDELFDSDSCQEFLE